MQDRRQSVRFSWNRPLDGTLYVLDDVVVERYVDGELTVLASMAAKPNDSLIVDRLAAGGDGRVNVRVVESGPTVVDGRLRHRLRLRAHEGPINGRPRVIGGLLRSIPVRLVDMSEGGCQMESGTPVENGLYAELEVAFADGVKSNRLRISRCHMVRGAGSLFRIGAQFSASDPVNGFRGAALRHAGKPEVEAR